MRCHQLAQSIEHAINTGALAPEVANTNPFSCHRSPKMSAGNVRRDFRRALALVPGIDHLDVDTP